MYLTLTEKLWSSNFHNVSVNSKPDHPPLPGGRPPGIRTFSLPRESSFRQTFFAREGRGFESEKFPTVLKKIAGTSRFVSKKLEAAWKVGVLVLFHINYTYLQNKRMRRCGVPPPPTNNFRKTLVTPTNYISSEREFIGESESSKIFGKYFGFAILWAIFAK